MFYVTECHLFADIPQFVYFHVDSLLRKPLVDHIAVQLQTFDFHNVVLRFCLAAEALSCFYFLETGVLVEVGRCLLVLQDTFRCILCGLAWCMDYRFLFWLELGGENSFACFCVLVRVLLLGKMMLPVLEYHPLLEILQFVFLHGTDFLLCWWVVWFGLSLISG